MTTTLDVSEKVKSNAVESNTTLLTLTVAIDLISTAVARVAGNDIADTLKGTPLVGETLDSVVAARLSRLLKDRCPKINNDNEAVRVA